MNEPRAIAARWRPVRPGPWRSSTARMAALGLALACTSAAAHDDHYAVDIGALRAVASVYTPAPESDTAMVYLTVKNSGKTADRLVSASTPLAQRVELHSADASGDRTHAVANIDIPAGRTIVMHPGHGYCLMLVGLAAPLKARTRQVLDLEFEHAGKARVTLLVKAPGTGEVQH